MIRGESASWQPGRSGKVGNVFTQSTIKFSALAAPCRFDLHRDTDIRYAGKIPTLLDGRVVPAMLSSHIEAAVAVDKDAGAIAALIVPSALAKDVPDYFGLGVSEAPQEAVARIQEHLAGLEGFQWESFESRVHSDARVAEGAYVAPRDVTIGAGSTVGPHASVLPRSVIGPNCHIGAGTVIGMEAFERMPGVDPRRLIVQSGGVRLERDVTIAANCSVSRATFGGFATIGPGTLIDANVYIAHDARIGRDVTICSGASLSGRVTLQDGCYIGPQAAVSNGLTIGQGATVSIGSVVTRSVTAGERVTGNFALPHEQWLNLVRTQRAT